MDFDTTLETITPVLTTLLTIGGGGALQLPSGIQTARPGSATAGAIRWNTTATQIEYYNGSAWIASGGSVTSISGSGGTTGLTLSGGPITTSGTLTLGGTLVTANGGTGLTSLGTANQILGVNTGATGLEYKTLASGGGIIITPTAGNISIATKNSATPISIIYVSKAGNDTTGNGSWDNPYLTVTKGLTVAATLANSTNQVTVFVLNGIYNEVNPIAISNENVLLQGQDSGSVFIRPTTNGQPLFNLSSGTSSHRGPVMSYLTISGPSGYSTVSGGSLIRVSGDGYFEFTEVYIDAGYIGIDCGNGTISAGQTVEWNGGDADNNNITVSVASSAQFWAENFTIRSSITSAIQASSTSSVTLNGYLVEGNLTTPVGTGISLSGSSTLLATSGQIRGFVTGLLAAGTSNSRVLSGYFSSNTYDFNQSISTAIVQIQGVYSATNPLVTNGSNVSLNYIDSNTNDFIVGAPTSTGNPGKTFRVRDYDGRVAIGDNSTDANIASGPATPSGSRSINLIDTNGNMRIWRFINTAGYDPSIEWIKGINPAVTDSDGQAPITSIVAATDTITIDVSGTAFNPPLASTPGIDRTTLAGRAFPAGRTFQVSGTASNNGTFTVISSTYNSGPQTISIVVTTNITVSEGAVGTVVFGGGAGRTTGPNPGNAAAAVAAGTGNVWWDTFLQESDYLVFRRRTGGGGSVTNEKVRIYPDHSEWLGASTYSDSDNALIFTAQNTAGAVNYLTLQNSVTTSPVLINAAGTDTDVSISLVPKGAGVVTAGGTRGLVAPSGTTAQQPASPVNGTIRYNTTTSLMEFRQNGAWVNIGTGTVTSVSTSGGTTGLTLTTTNPTTTPSITLAGTLAVANGGTGLTSTPSNGQIDIGNGTGFTRSTIAGGTGLSVTNGAGTITLANTGVTSAVAGTGISVSGATGAVTFTNSGVTSIAGTANQITASAATGAVTLSTPTAFIAPGSVQVTTTLLQTQSIAITAAGATQGTATLAPSRYNIVTTVAAGTGVILPLPVTPFGNEIYIANRGANPLNIYPNTGAAIVNGATNAPVVLPVGQEATFVCTSTTQWWTTESILAAGTNVTLTPSAGILTISATAGAAVPAGSNTQIQYNNSGAFGASSALTFTSGTNPYVTVQGTTATNQIRIGPAFTAPGLAAQYAAGATSTVYIETNGTDQDGQLVYFNNGGSAAVSGYIGYAYDTNTPYIRIVDADDDPPYVTFNTIGTGTITNPLYVSAFGARGTYASRTGGANSGFSWYVGANTNASALITANAPVMELDTQFLRVPTGTTANRPTPVVGMARYNTTTNSMEYYEPAVWVSSDGVIDKSTVNVAVTSAAAANIVSYTIPATTLGTDGIINLKTSGIWANTSGATRTITIAISYGGTTMWQGTSGTLATANTVGWSMNLFLAANNSATAQTLSGQINITGAGAPTTGTGTIATVVTAPFTCASIGGTAAINSGTTAGAFNVNITVSGATSTFTKYMHVIRKL